MGNKDFYVIEKKTNCDCRALRAAYRKISEKSILVLNGDSFCHFDIPNFVDNIF